MPADLIALATKHGATFERKPDGTWRATPAPRRKRAMPLAVFDDADQAEAARMLLGYFHHPVPKD